MKTREMQVERRPDPTCRDEALVRLVAMLKLFSLKFLVGLIGALEDELARSARRRKAPALKLRIADVAPKRGGHRIS